MTIYYNTRIILTSSLAKTISGTPESLSQNPGLSRCNI